MCYFQIGDVYVMVCLATVSRSRRGALEALYFQSDAVRAGGFDVHRTCAAPVINNNRYDELAASTCLLQLVVSPCGHY